MQRLITFLSSAAGIRLAKTLTTSYPHVFKFTSHQEECQDLPRFREVLISHAEQGHCLLKGSIKEPLKNQSRARSTTPTEPTHFLCLDLDGVQGFIPPDISHISQPSASDGLPNKPGVHKHLFFLLDKPATPNDLKRYLMQLNLQTPELKEQIKLSRTGMALHWPIDITVGQNDKLIYIAPRPDQELIFELVPGKTETLQLPELMPRATLDSQARSLLRKLREEAKLPDWTPEFLENKRVISNPTEFTITGRKFERDFVYYNLNGGDSWGYYHSRNDASVLYNFKGEPRVKFTEPFAAESKSSDEPEYFVFRDCLSDKFYTAIYQAPDKLTLSETRSAAMLNNFLKQHGKEKPDFIPDYELRFEFGNDVLVDHTARFVNKFVPTSYLREDPTLSQFAEWPVINRLIHSFARNDESFMRFLNWLAYIIQFRRRPHTAWVFYGVEGTGKGLFFSKVLVPIFGARHCTETILSAIDKFNKHFETSPLVLIDESETTRSDRDQGVISRLKNLITDDCLSIRRMRQEAYMGTNNANLIIASNERHPIHVPLGDRRFNVGERQETKLILTDEEYQVLESGSELQGFVFFLKTLAVDKQDAETAQNSASKAIVQAGSTTTLDEAIGAFKDGDLAYFIDSLPQHRSQATASAMPSPVEAACVDLIRGFVSELGQTCRVPRDDVRVLFTQAVGRMPEAAGKFTKMVDAHHGLEIRSRMVGDRQMRSAETIWSLSDSNKAQWISQHGATPGLRVVR